MTSIATSTLWLCYRTPFNHLKTNALYVLNVLTLCSLPTECIYVFLMALTINSIRFPEQH
jgi:hypothetical protein